MMGAVFNGADERDEALAAHFAERDSSPLPEKPLATESRRLRFIPASEMLACVKPTEWVIGGYVPLDSLGALYSEPEAGKSFAALGLACGVASDRSPYGLAVRRSGPVLVIIGEGRNAFANRIAAWSLHNRAPAAELRLFVSTTATELTNEIAVVELEAVIAEFIRDHGAPVMVIIDTLARNFGPGDENSTSDMGRAVAACDRVRELTKAAVILIHHSGKDATRGARGSMALRGAVDFEFRMARDGDVVRMECTKMKDSERPDPMAFRFQRVGLGITDEHGEEASSAVLVPLEHNEAGRPEVPARVQGKNQKLAMGLLRERFAAMQAAAISQGRDEHAVRVPTRAWQDMCADAGIDRKRFHDVMTSLQRASAIRIESGFAVPTGGSA